MLQSTVSTLSKMASLAGVMRPDSVPGPGPVGAAAFGLGVVQHGERAFDDLFERYGDVVALGVPEAVPGVSRVILFRDPALVRPVFTAPYDVLSNEGNVPIGELYGNTSMVLLDGPGHVRLRKLALPPLRGDALEQWRTLITDVAVREARALPLGEPVALHRRMLDAGLEISLRIVVGVEGADRLREWMPPMSALLAQAVSEEYSYRYLLRFTGAIKYWPRWQRAMTECNRLVYGEIARRRAMLARSETRSNDVLDVLLHAEGEPLSDQQIRDQIITILVAAHETSATALCWAIERLVRHPRALAKATAEAVEGTGMQYTEAVMNETLRLRPAIAFFGRLTRKPFRLGQYDIAPNTLIMPHLRGIHRNASLYPNPDEFRPERFLERKYTAFEFVPFGAGLHKCLGDRLAMFQTTIFLQSFLRELVLEPVTQRGEPMRRKTIVYTPGFGTVVKAQRRTTAHSRGEHGAGRCPFTGHSA